MGGNRVITDLDDSWLLAGDADRLMGEEDSCCGGGLGIRSGKWPCESSNWEDLVGVGVFFAVGSSSDLAGDECRDFRLSLEEDECRECERGLSPPSYEESSDMLESWRLSSLSLVGRGDGVWSPLSRCLSWSTLWSASGLSLSPSSLSSDLYNDQIKE